MFSSQLPAQLLLIWLLLGYWALVCLGVYRVWNKSSILEIKNRYGLSPIVIISVFVWLVVARAALENPFALALSMPLTFWLTAAFHQHLSAKPLSIGTAVLFAVSYYLVCFLAGVFLAACLWLVLAMFEPARPLLIQAFDVFVSINKSWWPQLFLKEVGWLTPCAIPLALSIVRRLRALQNIVEPVEPPSTNGTVIG